MTQRVSMSVYEHDEERLSRFWLHLSPPTSDFRGGRQQSPSLCSDMKCLSWTLNPILGGSVTPADFETWMRFLGDVNVQVWGFPVLNGCSGVLAQ
jgi:hypothetical protein